MNSPIYDKQTLRLCSNNTADLITAANILKRGGLVALPTETVYGLAANGLSSAAIEQVFRAKNRPLVNPLIFHVTDQNQALKLFNFDGNDRRTLRRFSRLASTFWPGPLTIIAKKADYIPGLATAHLDTVAVRIPHNQVTTKIIKECAVPLVMPSANLSTRPSPTSAFHVLATLDGRIDAVLDDGRCQVGIESTVVRIDLEQVKILRPGMIDRHAISLCLNETIEDNFSSNNNKPSCPGQAYLHYSPAINSVKTCLPSDAHCRWQSEDMFLARRKDFLALEKQMGPRPTATTNFVLQDEAKFYASELYDALYACESYMHKNLIIVLPQETDSSWTAIIDRLIKSGGIKANQHSNDRKH